MAKERSVASKFTSKYDGGFVTEAAYLTEILFEKMAQREKRQLPDKFWNLDEWKKPFVVQLVHANKLLKQYDVQVILSALRDGKTYFLTSLGANYMLKPLLEKYKRQSKKTEQILEDAEQVFIPDISSTQTPRKGFVNKNKMRDLND